MADTDNTKRAMIAMSGGVDSSVAAYLMKNAGYGGMGANMKLFNNEDIMEIEFEEPQRAVTKGQAVVLYNGDTVVGGGTII